ncbi:MAG: ribonuclease H [Nitriliruptoraceae bacterium]
MATVHCTDCDATFTPRAELLERYPGWTPSRCPACFRAQRGGARAGTSERPRSATGDPRPSQRPATPRGSSGRGHAASRRGGREEHLTVAEVLERYHDGPDSGVFTDGSAIPNPGPGGWGAVYVRDGEVLAEQHGYDPATTNNRMELRALQAAVELVPEGTPARIYTDSNLAVRTLTEWAAGWEKRGWRRKTGPVENLDLVQPLYEQLGTRPELELVWIKAHAGNRWNEYADALATAWARDEL